MPKLFSISSEAFVKAQRFFEDFVIRGRRIGDFPKGKFQLLWRLPQLSGKDAARFSEYEDRSISGASRYREEYDTLDVVITRHGTLVGLIVENRPFDNHDSDTSFKLQTLADLIEHILSNCRSKAMLEDFVIDYAPIQGLGPEKHKIMLKAAPHFGGALERARKHMQCAPQVIATRIGKDVADLIQWESGIHRPSYSALYRWCEALNLIVRPGKSLVQVINVSAQLLPLWSKDPTFLHNLSPRAFEQFVAERLDRMGYSVRLTGDTNRKDGGIDIVGVPKMNRNFLLAAQVKHHRTGGRAGRADVDRLLSWRGNPFSIGMLVTNTSFTGDAKWVASQLQNRSFLRLRDFEDLRKWLADNFSGEARELPAQIELAPGVLVEIPKPLFGPVPTLGNPPTASEPKGSRRVL